MQLAHTHLQGKKISKLQVSYWNILKLSPTCTGSAAAASGVQPDVHHVLLAVAEAADPGLCTTTGEMVLGVLIHCLALQADAATAVAPSHLA